MLSRIEKVKKLDRGYIRTYNLQYTFFTSQFRYFSGSFLLWIPTVVFLKVLPDLTYLSNFDFLYPLPMTKKYTSQLRKTFLSLWQKNLHKSVLEIPSMHSTDVIATLRQWLLNGRITESDLEDVPEVTVIAVHDRGSNQELFGSRVVDGRRVKVDPTRSSGRFPVRLRITKNTGWIFTKLFTQIRKNFCNFRP